MSSATSTDGAAATVKTAAATAAPGADRARGAFRPWHFFSVAALLAATAAVFVSPRTLPEQLVFLSLMIFAAAAAGYAGFVTVAPLFAPDKPLRTERLGAPARRALEREKTLVLRTIKELEFDRAMGKVAEEDFSEMSGRLRQRAMRLIRQVDEVESDSRARVERELVEYVGRSAPVNRGPAERACPSCDTINDPDARFCKGCGTALVRS